VFALVMVAQGKGNARRSSAAGAADSMYVGFRLMGEIVVHDVGDSLDVDSARGDIGGHQDMRPVRLEIAKVLCRAAWLLFPWMASARMPDCFNCRATRSAPCLVRVKTSARVTARVLQQTGQ